MKKALAEVTARREAEKSLAKAEEMVAAKQWAKALDLLDGIVKDVPGTEQADKAKARADLLRADEAIVKELKEQQAAKVCKGWLSMGRTYVKNGQKTRPASSSRRCSKEFPGTSYAAEAEAELKKLR